MINLLAGVPGLWGFRCGAVAGHYYYQRIGRAYRAQPLRSRAMVYLITRNAVARTAKFHRLFPTGLDVRLLATNRHLDVMNEPYLSQWMDELKRNLADRPAASPILAVASEAVSRDVQTVDSDESEDLRLFQVANNKEGQLSVWPVDWVLPQGWAATGFQGDRESCLARIGRDWTDQRPASLR